MRRLIFVLLILHFVLPVYSQKRLKGVIADSATHHPLPFATIKTDGQSKTIFSGINGQFSILIPEKSTSITVSYISYSSKQYPISTLNENDTLYLSQAISTLGEVIVKPQKEKIRRIINTAVRNKSLHNPNMYELYQCNIYYKMRVDLLPSEKALADSTLLRQQDKNARVNKTGTRDTSIIMAPDFNMPDNHLLLSETYSKRFYKRPEQLQEIVIASRLAGLKKTYFTSLVTDFLPFQVYTDYIPLSGKEYSNPIAKGWQQRYDFRLMDELTTGEDTTYILSFHPKKNVVFESLNGVVYINSDGYAISHFMASSRDSSTGHEIRIEQLYEKVNGRWFPKELNYDLIFHQYISPLLKLQVNGHSVIDSVSFTPGADFRIDKGYTVKLGDNVDGHTEADWLKLRPDSITEKEKNTYRIVDSISQKMKLEKVITSTGKLVIGRLPFRIVDIDITRVIASNNYEGTRWGMGLYTNENVSRFVEVGAWAGYGTKDKNWKYGFSQTSFIRGNKDNWVRLFYSDDYHNAGDVKIHEEIDRDVFRQWLLARPDRSKEFGMTGHFRKDYWEFELDGRKKTLVALYENDFNVLGMNHINFEVNELSLGIRYAYSEKREPVFGYYLPSSTKYPILYIRSSFGNINSGKSYSVKYLRTLIAVDFKKHINRWGNDSYRLEAGWMHSLNNKPLPPSFLLASKGFRKKGLSYYTQGGFLTMNPYDYYTDRYVSFLYKHDFDRFLWQLKFSKPFISVLQNMLIGGLNQNNRIANTGIKAPVNGYYESGIIVNQVLQKKILRSFYLFLNAGACYHWTSSLDWKRNGVWLLGVSFGL